MMAIPQQYGVNKWLNFSHIVCLKNEKKVMMCGIEGCIAPLCGVDVCIAPLPPFVHIVWSHVKRMVT
jgi:hypothetical protein